jgi:hypothetical protein
MSQQSKPTLRLRFAPLRGTAFFGFAEKGVVREAVPDPR